MIRASRYLQLLTARPDPEKEASHPVQVMGQQPVAEFPPKCSEPPRSADGVHAPVVVGMKQDASHWTREVQVSQQPGPDAQFPRQGAPQQPGQDFSLHLKGDQGARRGVTAGGWGLHGVLPAGRHLNAAGARRSQHTPAVKPSLHHVGREDDRDWPGPLKGPGRDGLCAVVGLREAVDRRLPSGKLEAERRGVPVKDGVPQRVWPKNLPHPLQQHRTGVWRLYGRSTSGGGAVRVARATCCSGSQRR